MALSAIRAALVARAQTVPGLKVLDHAPSSVQVGKLAYIQVESWTRAIAGDVATWQYRILIRACVPWQNNQGAEEQIVELIEQLTEAVDADPHLGGAVSAMASTREGSASWHEIAQAEYRTADIIVSAKDETPYAGGVQ